MSTIETGGNLAALRCLAVGVDVALALIGELVLGLCLAVPTLLSTHVKRVRTG